MRRERRLALAALLAVAGALLAVPALADDPEGSSATTVDDAVLRWGINDETSNRAFAPGTYNFLSAGRVPDPGRGNQVLARADWRQRSGHVRIEKWDGRAWRPATWAGLSTDSSGAPLGAPTAGTFSHHTFVMDGGTGTVDPEAGTAHIAWDGDLSVLYYSGMSFFYVSDPVLDVAGGRGTLTATVSGFASSQTDPTVWEPVAPRTVTMADLPDVDLEGAGGFSADPAYLGVLVSGVPQHTAGGSTGSFPQSWIDAMDDLGAAAFWYSSGGVTDAFKVPLPLTVGYDGAAGPPAPTPSAAPTRPPLVNEVVPSPRPTDTASPTATPTPSPTPAAAPTARPVPRAAPPVGRPRALASPTAPVVDVALPRPPTELAPTAAPAGPAVPGGDRSLPWWLGSAALLGAALVLLVPTPARPTPARTTQT